MKISRFLAIQDIKNNLTQIFQNVDYPLDALAKQIGQDSPLPAYSAFMMSAVPVGASSMIFPQFLSAVVDNLGLLDPNSNSGLTIPKNGLYLMQFHAEWNLATPGWHGISIPGLYTVVESNINFAAGIPSIFNHCCGVDYWSQGVQPTLTVENNSLVADTCQLNLLVVRLMIG